MAGLLWLKHGEKAVAEEFRGEVYGVAEVDELNGRVDEPLANAKGAVRPCHLVGTVPRREKIKNPFACHHAVNVVFGQHGLEMGGVEALLEIGAK